MANKNTKFGICVNNCDCTYIKKKLTKIFTVYKGQLVKLHSHNTDNVVLSLLDGEKTKLTFQNHLYFHVIDDKLFACLNAITSLDNRIKFYKNKENREFVLNLNCPTTVSVTVLNQQLKGLFQEQTNVKGKIFFTVELLQKPSKQLISVIKENCRKYIAGKYQLTVAANMIQQLNLPDVTIDQKIEESLNFEQDKKQKWCCSICHQENWFKTKKCRKCDSPKSDGASFPGANNYLSGKYHPQSHNDHSVAMEEFPPNESYDRSFVDCYNMGSTRTNKNDKLPVNRLRNQNQSNDNVNGMISCTEGASKPDTEQCNFPNGTQSVNELCKYYEDKQCNDNVNGVFSRTMGACKPEIVQNNIKSRLHKFGQLCQIYKNITAEKPSTLNQKKPDDFKIPNQFVEAAKNKWTCQVCFCENTQSKCDNCDEPYEDEHRPSYVAPTPWTCTVCLTINEVGNNCSKCNEKHDDIPLDPTPASVRIDTNLIVSSHLNPDDISDPYQIDKNNSQAVENNENADLLEYYMITVLPNMIETECLSCDKTLDILKGFVLQLCNHTFCETCIKARITNYCHDNLLEQLKCRARIDNKMCDRKFELSEIKYFLADESYEKLKRQLIDANETNSFIKMCCDKNCSGHYLCEKYYQSSQIEFVCGKCNLKNCLQCTAIHEGLNCSQYGKLIGDGSIDKETVDMFLTWIRDGIAIPCPECNTLIEKDEGCDWVQCPICQTEICWATRGRRWGPGGSGDTSGGCGCTKEKKCIETCNYCH